MTEAIAYLKRIEPGEGKLLPDLSDEDQPFTMPFNLVTTLCVVNA